MRIKGEVKTGRREVKRGKLSRPFNLSIHTLNVSDFFHFDWLICPTDRSAGQNPPPSALTGRYIDGLHGNVARRNAGSIARAFGNQHDLLPKEIDRRQTIRRGVGV